MAKDNSLLMHLKIKVHQKLTVCLMYPIQFWNYHLLSSFSCFAQYIYQIIIEMNYVVHEILLPHVTAVYENWKNKFREHCP